MSNPQPSDLPPLGLIAGAGHFPFLVAEGARRAGRPIVIVGLRGFANPALKDLSDRFYWAGLVRIGRWIRCFRKEGVTGAILAGHVRKTDMYGRFRMIRYLPDLTAIRLWFHTAQDKRNDTLLCALADEMQRQGITLENSVSYCPQAMAEAGTLTDNGPTPQQDKDIDFGWRIAKAAGKLDIGQSIAVKEQEVIAVEAIEGTDRMIARAGELCRQGGWILVKVGKPDQDMRFDVPTVGPDTIENLKRHGAKGLVIEAGVTLMIEREKLLSLAKQYGIFVCARQGE